nr:DHA2 family efflux MFS transporter permease subunit [Ardenticatenales bacterium]
MDHSAEKPERLAYKWKVLISVIFGMFMVILDTTVVNIAFRTLQEEFASGVNDSQWVISIYVLMLGISTPLSGFLGDRFGLKRVFLTGLTIFVFGSLLCGLAPSLWVLVAARALQGIGGGVALPLGTALLFTAFPPKEQGTALGLFGIALVTGPALGPILGGWLVDLGHWRWIFFINVPIGIVGVTMGWRWLRDQQEHHSHKIDLLGLLCSTVGFGSVLYAASRAADEGWTSSTVTTWFAIGTVALIAFAIVELFIAKEPLLDLRLFKNATFTTAIIVGWVSVVALFGAEFLLPLYLQILRGYSALETGLILLPLAIAAGITLPLAGRLYDKVGARPLVVTGFTLLIINTWQLSKLTLETPISWLLFLLALRGLALGLTVQTTMVTALSTVPMPKLSRGSALVNSTRQVIQSIAVAFLATVLASSVSPGVTQRMEAFEELAPRGSTSTMDLALCEIPNASIPGIPGAAKDTFQQFCDEYILG